MASSSHLASDSQRNQVQISKIIEETRLSLTDFPSLVETYGAKSGIGENPKNGSLSSKDGFVPEVEFTPLHMSSPWKLGTGADDCSFSYAKKIPNEDFSLGFQPLSVVGGKKVPVLSLENYKDDIKTCENLVIGFFIGHRLPFSKVKDAVTNVWKTKSEVNITIHGNNVFIFNFMNDEERKSALEQGAIRIYDRWFFVRPWCPMIERSIVQMKTVPIWLRIYNIPLHFWNKLGLSSIASYIGNPLMMDECTAKKSRLSYARVCVEINTDCTYPNHIPLWVDGVFVMDLPVEYQWKPHKCINCSSFGHTVSNCSLNGVKEKPKSHWIPKKIQQGTTTQKDDYVVNGGQEVLVNIPMEQPSRIHEDIRANTAKEGTFDKDMTHLVNGNGVQDILDQVDSEGNLQENWNSVKRNKSATRNSDQVFHELPNIDNQFDLLSTIGHDKEDETTSVIFGSGDEPNLKVSSDIFVKKKKKSSNKSTETLIVEKEQEIIGMEVVESASPAKEAASSTSTDPSIPPGFESYNRLRGSENEEEVATSTLEAEDLEISINRPSSSEPILVSNRKVSLKSKATGLFPMGTLSTKKNGSSKSLDTSNKISTNKLVDFGTEWGLSFPSSKQKCRDMCSDVVKNHKHLSLEDIDESSS